MALSQVSHTNLGHMFSSTDHQFTPNNIQHLRQNSPTPSQGDALTRHSYANSQNRHDCSQPLLRILSSIRNQRILAFDAILDVGREIAAQWETTLLCERCQANRQCVVVLRMVAERTLTLYEAACTAYGVAGARMDLNEGAGVDGGFTSHHRSSSQQNSTPSSPGENTACHNTTIICLKGEMRLGQMKLEDSDARLLARVLLSRRLMKMGALLEDLRGIIDGLWNENWAQQTDTLRACEVSIAGTIDRVIVLVGQLR